MISRMTSLGKSSRFSPPRIAATHKSSQLGGVLYGAPHPSISIVVRYLSFLNLISSEPSSPLTSSPVQRLCITTRYLLSIPSTVDAWLTSPEFGKLQQFEFYHYHESFIPRTHQEFMPHHRFPSRSFPPLSTPPPSPGANYQMIWYKCFDSHY